MMIHHARHAGAGSGCQGCDPDVPMPDATTPVFICALCALWFELHGIDDIPEDQRLDLLEKRRDALVVEAVIAE